MVHVIGHVVGIIINSTGNNATIAGVVANTEVYLPKQDIVFFGVIGDAENK